MLRSGALAITAADSAVPAPSGKGTPGDWVPWPDAGSAPRIARAGERWVAAWELATGEAASAVFLYRGSAAESLGAGDAFVAADLQCGASRCALLTSRKAAWRPQARTWCCSIRPQDPR